MLSTVGPMHAGGLASLCAYIRPFQRMCMLMRWDPTIPTGSGGRATSLCPYGLRTTPTHITARPRRGADARDKRTLSHERVPPACSHDPARVRCRRHNMKRQRTIGRECPRAAPPHPLLSPDACLPVRDRAPYPLTDRTRPPGGRSKQIP